MLFILIPVVVESKYVIEYTRKVEYSNSVRNFAALCMSPEGTSITCERFYQKTEHHVAETVEEALAWINLKGRYATFRFTDFGKEEIHPVDGFEFVALYKCAGPMQMFQKQIGQEIKIVQVKEEHVVPVMEWSIVQVQEESKDENEI